MSLSEVVVESIIIIINRGTGARRSETASEAEGGGTAPAHRQDCKIPSTSGLREVQLACIFDATRLRSSGVSKRHSARLKHWPSHEDNKRNSKLV
jgi:hypothetical protein